MVHLSHPYMTTRKTIALTIWTFVGKVMSLFFNMLPRFPYCGKGAEAEVHEENGGLSASPAEMWAGQFRMVKPHCPLYPAPLPRGPGPPHSRTMPLALLAGAGPLEVCPSLFPGPALSLSPSQRSAIGRLMS